MKNSNIINYPFNKGWSIKTPELQKIISNRYVRNQIIKELIKQKAEPSLENLKMVLYPDIDVSIINKEILDICINIYNNGKTINIPIPNTDNAKNFF